MATVNFHGRMEVTTRVNLREGRNMERGSYIRKLLVIQRSGLFTKVSSMRTKEEATGRQNGPMGLNTKANLTMI